MAISQYLNGEESTAGSLSRRPDCKIIKRKEEPQMGTLRVQLNQRVLYSRLIKRSDYIFPSLFTYPSANKTD